MAIAGPAGNLLILLGAGICIRAGVFAGWFTPGRLAFAEIVAPLSPGGIAEFAAMFLSVAFSLNLLLMTFNLIPLPPFDGASIPLFFLRGSAAESWQQFMWNPTVQFFSFIAAYRGFGAVFSPIFSAAANLLYHGHAQYR